MSASTESGKVESEEICGLTMEEVLIAGPCVAVMGQMIQNHPDLIPDAILVYLLQNLEELATLSRKLVEVYKEEGRKASQ